MNGANQYIGSAGSAGGTPTHQQLVACGDATHTCSYDTSAHIWANVGITGSGSAGTPPYSTTVSAQTALTVTAATHGQGVTPFAFCYDNSTPRNFVACNYTVSTTGTVIFAWTPAFTGEVLIEGATGGFPNPMTLADQYVASAGNAGTPATFGQLVACGSATAFCKYDTATHTWTATNNTTQANGDVTISTATDAFVAAALASQNPAVSVEAATTGVLPNSPTYSNGTAGVGATLTAGSAAVLTVDGYTPALNEPLLIKNQASAFQNGIYTVTTLGTVSVPYVLTRRDDYNTPTNINYTGTIPVLNGSTNANTGWNLTTQITTIGTDALTYSAAGSVAPPNGNVKANGNLANGNVVEGAGGKTIQDTGIAFSKMTQTIGSAAITINPGAITSATCSSAITATITGTATTDTILATINADPTATTGYVPSTSGSLYFWVYPTTNTVNVKVCNPTSGSVTPTSTTLNARVVR